MFLINQITRFSKKGGECVEETDYIFTQCLHNYARSASKCDIGAIEKKCTKESFIKYFQILIHLKRQNIANVKMESGCYPKCRHIIYTLEVIEKAMDGQMGIQTGNQKSLFSQSFRQNITVLTEMI